MKLVLAVAAATLALIGTAHAGLVGPVIVQDAIANLQSGSQDLENFGSVSSPGGSAEATESLAVAASGETFINNVTGRFGGGGGLAEIEYFYIVVAPANVQIPVEVPLIITGSVLTRTVGGPTSTAEASVTGAFGTIQACAGICAGSGPLASQNFDEDFEVPSGIQQDVGLFALSQGGEDAANSLSTANASADPIITIDPAFLADNPGFSLAFSPNIQQPTPTSSVPEPATLALFGMGFIGLGMIRRPRRRAV